jgi:hypothetical protein
MMDEPRPMTPPEGARASMHERMHERMREKLAESEQDLARNAVERIWLGRILVALPIAGAVAWAILVLLADRAPIGLIVFAGALGTAVVTYGTGMYMTAVRRREFEDAIRDARAEIASIERSRGRVSSAPGGAPNA